MHLPFITCYLLSSLFLFPQYSHVLLVSLVIVILKRPLENMNSTEILLPQAQQTDQHLSNKTMSYLGRNILSSKEVDIERSIFLNLF